MLLITLTEVQTCPASTLMANEAR